MQHLHNYWDCDNRSFMLRVGWDIPGLAIQLKSNTLQVLASITVYWYFVKCDRLFFSFLLHNYTYKFGISTLFSGLVFVNKYLLRMSTSRNEHMPIMPWYVDSTGQNSPGEDIVITYIIWHFRQWRNKGIMAMFSVYCTVVMHCVQYIVHHSGQQILCKGRRHCQLVKIENMGSLSNIICCWGCKQ